jgi:O-methyltransferase
VSGDVVECGVWRGGSSMVAALALQQEGDAERRLWLYDTFEGMCEPTPRDRSFGGLAVTEHWEEIRSRPGDLIRARADLQDVQANMASSGVAAERVEYVRGPVEETIPGRVPDRIASLRLDTEWYESTKHELEHVWERLEPGGVLIIHDYGH